MLTRLEMIGANAYWTADTPVMPASTSSSGQDFKRKRIGKYVHGQNMAHEANWQVAVQERERERTWRHKVEPSWVERGSYSLAATAYVSPGEEGKR